MVIKGKEKGKWKRKGKVGSYTLEVEGKEKKERVREVVIEGRNREIIEGGKVLAYCHRAIRAG